MPFIAYLRLKGGTYSPSRTYRPVVFLGVDRRYLWAKQSFGGQDIKLDGITVTGDLGFRF